MTLLVAWVKDNCTPEQVAAAHKEVNTRFLNEDLPPAYDRKALVDILVYHWRTNTAGCGCGWDVLGASHPEHVADVYEMELQARTI